MGIKNYISSFILRFSNVKLKEILVDHHKYLGKRENPLKIYDRPPKNMILSPFNMIFDPIDRLLLVNFEEDPIYYSIELQIFHKLDIDYPLVIMYRKDNMMDIYYTNEIVIKNRKKMVTDLLTSVSFNQLDDIEYKFQFDEMGLDAYLFLIDKLEKEIEFKIKESTPEKELTSILTPISAVSKKPEYFPIVFLKKFGMVIKKNTEIFVKIHGFLRKTTEMPIQMNKMSFYLAHYSLEPIICNWNNIFSGNINPIILNPPTLNISEENITFILIRNSDYYEIKKISGKDEQDYTVSFEFSPAIPNLLSLGSNLKTKGRFSCIIDKKKGIFAGEYYLTRTGDTIEFSIQPTKGWQLFPGKLWLKTYKWVSEIQIKDIGYIFINSYWQRIKG
ncbi:MAG: hypothetical protein KGD72_02150 [Candidatus Lokiarchaeota archaeon]|nr:hypothetical protein [Candidatus Lokiarchaeota archaeon]